MSRSTVDWHWPRAELAEHYLRMFEVVQAHAMVLFAPRGKGKTEFMTKDVMPTAVEHGFFPVYVNFWDDQANPAASLRYALLREAQNAGLYAKLSDVLSRTGFDVTVGINLGVANLSIKSKTDAKPTSTAVHFEMRQIADALIKCCDRQLLLIFDEVQTLAAKSEHDDFVRSLRTMLDERRGDVCSIFTGSSQTRLTEMFARLESPLYNFAQQVEFPSLGDPFLQHWMETIQTIMCDERELTLDAMRQGFDVTNKNPRIFWGAVMKMIASNSLDIVSYARQASDETTEMAGVRQRIEELTPLDRLVLRNVVFSTQEARKLGRPVEPQLFSKEARDLMRVELGLTPTPSQIQGSLRRLMNDDMQLVVSKTRGQYEIEDAFFIALMEEMLIPLDSLGKVQPILSNEPPLDLKRIEP